MVDIMFLRSPFVNSRIIFYSFDSVQFQYGMKSPKPLHVRCTAVFAGAKIGAQKYCGAAEVVTWCTKILAF